MKTKIIILCFLIYQVILSQKITKQNIINDSILWNYITEDLKNYEVKKNIKLKVVTKKDNLIFRKLKNGYLVREKSIPRFSTITLIDSKAYLMRFDKNRQDYFVKIVFNNDTGYVHSGFLFQFKDIEEKKEGTVYSKTNSVNIRSIYTPFQPKKKTKSIFDKFIFTGKVKTVQIPKGIFDFAILKNNNMIALKYLQKVYGLYRNPLNQKLYLLELNEFSPGKIFDITEYPEIKNIIKYAKLLEESQKKLKSQTIALNIRNMKQKFQKFDYENIKENFLLNYINYYLLENITLDHINIFCDIHGLTSEKINHQILKKFIQPVINDTNNINLDKSIDSLEILINNLLFKMKILEFTKEKGKYYLFKKTIYDITLLSLITVSFSKLPPFYDNISNTISQYEPENIKAPKFIKDIKSLITSNRQLLLAPLYIAYLYRSYHNSFSLTENEFKYIMENFKSNQILNYKTYQLQPIDSTFWLSFNNILDSLCTYLNINNETREKLNIKWQECMNSTAPYQIKNRYAIYLYQNIIISYYQALYGEIGNQSYSYKIKKYFKNLFKKSISTEEEKIFENIMNFFEWSKNFNLIKK